MPRVTLGGRSYELPTRGLSVSQRQLIEELVDRSNAADVAPYIDVADYGYDRAAIVAAVAAAVADGCRHIRFTRGTYTVSQPPGMAYDGYAVEIPSNFLVDGERGHEIVQTNLTANDAEAGKLAYAVLRVIEPAENVVFRGLHFRGEKPTASYVLNHQAAAIDICPDIHGATVSKDILVSECVFDDLWGFTIHARGLGERVHAIGNTVRNCANGININVDYSIQAFNSFTNSEGIENSGKWCAFVGNVFKGCLGVALSIGGAGENLPGCTVVGNTVNGSTVHGIVVGGGLQYGVISENTVRNCEQHGILITIDEFGAAVDGLVISNNVVIDNAASGVIAGLAVHGGTKHVVTGNVCISTGDATYVQRCGLSVTATDCVVSGNVCKGGGGNPIDLSIGVTALRTILGPNQCLTGTEQFTGTVEPDRRSWPSADTVIAQDRVWNGPSGTGLMSGRVNFRRYASGKMEWGDGSSPVDTVLYRSAADTLKTDDKFIAAAGLGVGNSAVASTPGTVVRRIQVFDASGNSLGYIAVYDAIT